MPESVVAQLVAAMRALAGSHPGFRPAHAKGIVCSGTFRASQEARGVSRAAHLQGQQVPTVIRFANSSGDPEVHDGLPSVRSMAVKFDLPDGKHADILANSVEGFPARTPEEFLGFLQAQLPVPATGKPDPDAVPRFLTGHPAARGFIDRLMQRPVPASYGQSNYFAEHAFRLLPLIAAADLVGIAGCRMRVTLISRLTMGESGARTSSGRSWMLV